jgi:hypothetical protein
VRSLSQPARDAALLAAAALQPTVLLVEKAAGGADGLTAAAEVGVVAVEGKRLRFARPLLAEATYAGARPSERRSAHERLAASATSSLERAHHLARCVEAPDEQIAAELEAAASEAAALGMPGTAAGLAAAAARLSVRAEDRTRRAVKAAELRIVSGDPEGARVDLESLVTELPLGTSRARVLALIADVVLTIDPARSLALQDDALAGHGRRGRRRRRVRRY